MNETTKRIAERFQCRYTVFEKGTSPEAAEQAYKAALERGRTDGFYPALFLLDDYAVEWLEDVVSQDYDRNQIIASCGDNGREILEERYQEYMEDFNLDGENQEEFIGNETEGEELHHFIGYCSFSDRNLEADVLLDRKSVV